jgi:hypothetical protein
MYGGMGMGGGAIGAIGIACADMGIACARGDTVAAGRYP